MGNDIARGKVQPVPEVIDSPAPVSNMDEFLQSCPSVFSASVVTRVQSCQLKEETNLADSLLASTLACPPDPPDQETACEWNTVYQIFVPFAYRHHVLSLAHDHPLSCQESQKHTIR